VHQPYIYKDSVALKVQKKASTKWNHNLIRHLTASIGKSNFKNHSPILIYPSSNSNRRSSLSFLGH